MASASARVLSGVLRRQALAMHVAVPISFGLIGLSSGLWASTAVTFFATAGAVVAGFGIGVCLAQRLEAAASALECSVEIADLLRTLSHQLTTQAAAQHAQTLESLRNIAEQISSGNARGAELVRALADQEQLTRLESTVEPANLNRR